MSDNSVEIIDDVPMSSNCDSETDDVFRPNQVNKEMIGACRVLVVGAGGLGCEILKNLALSGFKNVEVIDMDTIELSNLNRQFLFRRADIGKSKAEVAAQFITSRRPECQVVAHNCKIEEKGLDFYRKFHIIISGLDSVNARLWLNNMIVGMVRMDGEGKPLESTIIPLIDGGTEGFYGNGRVILPYITPCIGCTLNLYPKQETYPTCTIATRPRRPEHCVEYVRSIQWNKENPFGEEVALDGDNPDHIDWALWKAQERAKEFKIEGVTRRLTQGVIKHIIPAVASTNAVVAAFCVLEAIKLVSGIPTVDNYMNFQQQVGASMQVVRLERDEDCLHCGSALAAFEMFEVRNGATLSEFLDLLRERKKVVNPVVQASDSIVYSPMENMKAISDANLKKTLTDLGIGDDGEVVVTDDVFGEALLTVRVRYRL